MLASVGTATAATVTGDLNLRAGPGTRYAVIDTMPAGAHVNVLGCGGGWCRVAWHGTVGYASRNYLAGRGYAYAPGPYYTYEPGPYYYDYAPWPVFGFGFGGGYGGYRGGYHGGYHGGHHGGYHGGHHGHH